MNDLGSPEAFMRAAGGTTETHRPGRLGDEVGIRNSGNVSDGISAPTRAPMECVALSPVGAAKIPPRQWAYGRFLLFGQVAVLGAVDGGGKGAWAVAVALAMITGQALLGERVWRTGPVAIITYEDDKDEWHRRIAAACIHHGIKYELAIDNIQFITRPRERIVFAAMENGRVLYPDSADIIATLCDLKAALLIVDPLNHAHGFDDGNNNVLIAKVAAEMNRIAWESGAAVLVLHHLRKGASGLADDLMGATSLRATFRSCRILAKMTQDEAKPLGLGVKHETWRNSRIAGTKENYAPPPDKATWSRLESVALGNVTVDERYPDGDVVQVSTVWQPPAAFDGMDRLAISAVFDAIRGGLPDGKSFAPRRQATKRWVGQTIINATGKTADQAARVVKQWTDNGVLVVEKYTSPTRRDEAERVVLDEQKAAAILQGLAASTPPIDQ